eukprot:TRINITY_DN24976_c0_g1_i1.p1 TRINITY_DN24976_c0_g1~~TRINITY_DN24976_c0_g1_i1.p1  ORF type:complete len:379 (+),score=83.20 TRINITY_DN24976_c0_g1_i1:258-1394(+)
MTAPMVGVVGIEQQAIDQEELLRPTELPLDGLAWATLDLSDPEVLVELQSFLEAHYVDSGEDGTDWMLRFKYSAEFLRWDLMDRGEAEWMVGVRGEAQELLGFIAGTPLSLSLDHQPAQRCCEINFYCVHPSLRSAEVPGLRMANLLQQEVTRRVLVSGVQLAFYTGGVVLSDAFALADYWHLCLNLDKLLECHFTTSTRQPTPAQLSRAARDEASVRRFEEGDVVACLELLNMTQQSHKFKRVFDEKELLHTLHGSSVVHTFVLENKESGVVTDFFSFYSLASTVLYKGAVWDKGPVHMAYMFYQATSTITTTDLVQLATNKMQELEFDVCTVLNIGGLADGLQDCGYRCGTGTLRYYVFNASMPVLSPEQIGVVAI